MFDNLLIVIFTIAFGVLLEVARRSMVNNTESDSEIAADEINKFREELLEERRQLKKTRDEWQDKYYTEHELRLKVEWQLTALAFIEEELKKKI